MIIWPRTRCACRFIRRFNRGRTSRAAFREKQRVVAAHHVARYARFKNAALLEQYRAIAQFKHSACVVCHEQNGRTARTELLDSRVTLACKRCVANRENLIRDEDVRVTRHCNSKRESREHAARIRRDWIVNRVTNSGELQNRRQLRVDFSVAEPNERCVQTSIFASAEVGMKSRAKCEEWRKATLCFHSSRSRTHDAAENA